MPKMVHYTRISLHGSDWTLQIFSFHETVMLMVFIVMELKTGLSTSCKHCHFRSPARSPVLALKWPQGMTWLVHLLESSGNSDHVSNLGSPLFSPSIPEHALLCLSLHWPLPEGFISGSANSKRSQGQVIDMGGMLREPSVTPGFFYYKVKVSSLLKI